MLSMQVCKEGVIKEAKPQASMYFDFFFFLNSTLFSQFPDWVSGMATLEDI